MDSANLLIIKYHPLPCELTKVTISVACTEEGCPRTFSSEANMRQHLRKFHKKKESENPNEFIVRQYHCPIKGCVYNEKNVFATLKYLKQHYIKVHAEKKFGCEKCKKKFPTQYLMLLHAQSCGDTFKCLECENQYSCYESLLTHARRKRHNIGSKDISHPWSIKKKNITENNNDISRYKLISQSKLLHVVANPVAQDKGVQTDAPVVEVKPKTKRRATRQTQTCSRKKTRKSAETQTSAAATSKPASVPIQVLQEELNKICLETQGDDCTADSSYFQQPPETETGLVLKLESSDPNLGGLDSLNFIHSTLQTNNTNLFDCNSFSNCNTQTQTDFIFENDFLSAETQTNHLDDLDLYTSMYTQTYDDFLLPDAYETLMTQSVLNLDINDREMNNTQTQTEIEYLQLLEEINA